MVVPFTDTSSRPEMVLNIFQNQQENTKTFRQGCFPINFVKFLRNIFYRTPPLVASSYNTSKNKIILSSFTLLCFAVGSSIKDVRTNLGIFATPLPLSRPVHIWLTTPSPCPCGHKAGIIWNIATCEQSTLKGKKNWSFCLKIM